MQAWTAKSDLGIVVQPLRDTPGELADDPSAVCIGTGTAGTKTDDGFGPHIPHKAFGPDEDWWHCGLGGSRLEPMR